MKIATILGARPQFIKAAVVSRALHARQDVKEILIHTGQHYDENMSGRFFKELDITAPTYNLEIGSADHGAQTGRMLEKVETVLQLEKPDWVLVYGDTNSTLAGALAAAKLHIRVAHVEAGLRSFNRLMPEEINRVLTDHLSEQLFSPTIKATENLHREGIAAQNINQVGDVMYDAALFFGERAGELTTFYADAPFTLATVHRAENTDDPKRMTVILEALSKLGEKMSVIMPLHPRSRKTLYEMGQAERHGQNIHFIEPLGYLDMVAHERRAALIVTDSGGVQKEAYFFKTPCVTLRDETEWTELVDMGWNRLTPLTTLETVMSAIEDALSVTTEGLPHSVSEQPYGDGTAGEKIAAILAEKCNLQGSII